MSSACCSCTLGRFNYPTREGTVCENDGLFVDPVLSSPLLSERSSLSERKHLLMIGLEVTVLREPSI